MMKRIAGLSILCVGLALAQEPSRNVPLTVPAGTPLRLYLTKRIPRRLNAPVQARMLAPLYAFDREVIPAGTEVFGTVTLGLVGAGVIPSTGLASAAGLTLELGGIAVDGHLRTSENDIYAIGDCAE